VSLDGNLKVSRNVLLPLNEDGSYMCGDSKENFPEDENGKKQAREGICYVETSFSVVSSGWNDVLIDDVTLPNFEMVGLKNWGFNVENAVLDLSDTLKYTINYYQLTIETYGAVYTLKRFAFYCQKLLKK